jgi:hypothetical protein
MPSVLTPKQVAFDAAVKAQANFDFRGIADLEVLCDHDASFGPLVHQLIEIRDMMNAALAVEGQNIVGDAPHAPFYFDYIDSPRSQALAFKDADHSFVGVTIPLVFEVRDIAQLIVNAPAVVSGIGLPHDTNPEMLHGVLFWMLFGFITSHEYAHHTHGHWTTINDGRHVIGRLQRQAREADADGWAAYLTLAFWLLSGGRAVVLDFLNLRDAPVAVQDDVTVACFVVAQAAFTFLREPNPIDEDKVYWDTHPPQPVRLQLMSRYVLKFIGEFRPGARNTMTQPRYQSLMDAVSRLMWTNGRHAALWREHHDFLRTPEGIVYRDALISELDVFRAALRQWEVDARAALPSDV